MSAKSGASRPRRSAASRSGTPDHGEERAEDLLALDPRRLGQGDREASGGQYQPSAFGGRRARGELPALRRSTSTRKASTRSLASASITGGDLRGRSCRPARRSARDTAPARRSTSLSAIASWTSTRARGGALLAGISEGRVERSRARPRRGRRRRPRSRVLAAGLGHHALQVGLAGGVSPAARTISRPTALEPVKANDVHARVAHERGARLAIAGQERQRVRPARPRREGPPPGVGARGRLLRRLEHHRVARRQRRRRSCRREWRAGSSTARSPPPRRAARSAARCARREPGRSPRPWSSSTAAAA